MFKDTIMKPSGIVTTALTRPDGSLINQVQTNTFTLVGAERIAAALNGEAGTLTVTNIQTSSGGPRIYDFDSTTGFTGTATLDSGIYRQGVGAFKIEAPASGTQYVYDASTISDTNVPTGSSIELWLRFTTVTRVNKASSQLRIFSAGNASSYYGIALSDLETAAGVTFADATWARCRVPISSFGITAGAPSWTTASGIGLNLVAGTAGTATAYIDNAFIVNGNLDVTSAATAVPSVYDYKAVTRSRSTRTVTASATWQLADAIGETFYVLGLQDGSGNLLAITGYAAGSGIYKEPNSILNVSWALTTTA